MSKDFQKQILDEHYKENEKLDPFVYITPQMNEYVQQIKHDMSLNFLAAFLASNVILAPLQTVITSLQLSVSKHKNIYQSQQARSKQLARLNTEMTVHDKRKFQLMIRAGGKSTPYVAPVYNGYKQTIQGLLSQSWKGFFKGLGWRTVSTYMYFVPYFFIPNFLDQMKIQNGVIYENAKIVGACTLVDLVINPIYLMEYRYILQNRIPQFRVMRNPLTAIKKVIQKQEALKGLSFHIINNSIGFVTRFPLYYSLILGAQIPQIIYPLYAIGEAISYPFLTAYKRLQCQTQRYPGMIPVRYSGLFHALRVIMYEEGVKGLWRAFPLHLTQNFMRIGLIKLMTQQQKPKN